MINMKTYYSNNYDQFNAFTKASSLFLNELQKELNQHISKDIAELKQPFFTHIAIQYQFAASLPDGLSTWRNVIKTYYELIKLNLQLNKHQQMYELYGWTSLFLSEGNQELYYCEEQIKNIQSPNSEILFKLNIDKYHTLYESCLRYSFTLAIWCLDNISGHSDMNSDYEKLLKDDVSYKIDKLDKCTTYNFLNSLSNLKKGVEPLVRNSIAHKTFEYLENGKIKFINRDSYKEYDVYEFQTLVNNIHVNYFAQLTAITLFAFDNNHKIDMKKIRRYNSDKQLRIIIDQEFRVLSFIPVSIKFVFDGIICEVETPIGYDVESQVACKINNTNFNATLSPMDIKNAILNVIYQIAGLRTNYKYCKVTVFEFNSKNRIGYIEINLEEWTKLYDSSPSTETLDSYIIKSSFGS